jgi:hypothetical protein
MRSPEYVPNLDMRFPKRISNIDMKTVIREWTIAGYRLFPHTIEHGRNIYLEIQHDRHEWVVVYEQIGTRWDRLELEEHVTMPGAPFLPRYNTSHLGLLKLDQLFEHGYFRWLP